MIPADELVSFRRVPAALRRTPLKQFARALRDQVTGGREFHCLITDDQELRRLNNQFRSHNHATDVLSFPLHGEGQLGDVAISAGRAAAQAKELGHSQLDEIRILMLHGVLHLMGMDHETDRGAMARAESRWRKKLDLPVGLIARGRS
jgi:probable rRNA maturation factor